MGRNGIVVWKADDVSIENLTVCNFLAGSGASGNEIWWNGGDDSGKIGLHGYTRPLPHRHLDLLRRRDHRRRVRDLLVELGGPGLVGPALRQQLQRLGHVRRRLPAAVRHHHRPRLDGVRRPRATRGPTRAGPSSIENSQFDNNEDGLDTNTQIDGDPPAPQNGACPGNATSPITHTHSCWVFIHNSVHDNNNPNVPAAGSAAAGPTGTGMTVSGGTQRHRHGQHVLEQRRVGHPLRALPRQQPARPAARRARAPAATSSTGSAASTTPRATPSSTTPSPTTATSGTRPTATTGRSSSPAATPQNCFAGNNAPDGSTPANLEQIQPTCDGTHHRLQHRWPAFGPGAVRHRLRHVPGGGPVPQAQRRRHAPPAYFAPHHAQPVCGRARQRVVPGRPAGLSGRGIMAP